MKIKLFLFLTIIISLNIFSQNISIAKGGIIKDRQFLIDKNEITTCDINGNFVSIRPHRINGTLRNYYIEFFNGLNFLERQEIKTENSTKILKVYIKNNKVHILIKEEDKKNISLRFDLFNLDKKKLIQKKLILINKDNDKDLYKSLKNDIPISENHDENYLVSFPVIDTETAYTYLEYFDSDLNSISSHKVYPNKNIHRKNTSFLNVSLYNNKVYILYSLTDEEDSNYYQLTEFKNGETRDIILPIQNDIYQLINAKVFENSYIISGLFSKQKKGAFEGFLYYNINLDTFEVAYQQLSNFLTENARKYFIGFFKNNRSIDIKDIFIDEEKNTYLIGQFYTIRKQYVPIGITFITSVSTFITYNPFSISYKVYDDILISKINSNGELIWDNIFELKQTEKIQSKSNKKDSSYYAFLQNNQLNILMNGFINMEKDKLIMKQDKRNSKTNFYNIIVNPDGTIIPKIIFPNADSDILFRAEGTIKFNNTIFNLGQGNMRKQLMKLSLEY